MLGACLNIVLLVAAQGNAGYPRADLLTEVTDLATPEAIKAFVILDVRPRAKYLEAHIPGAVWVDHDGWSKAFAADPNDAGWAKLIGGRGIGVNSRCILYDDASANHAARIWWILRYFGVKDVRLLNGGWSAWRAANGLVEKGDREPAPVEFSLNPLPNRLATKSQVLDFLKGKQTQIIDARSAGEFCGDKQTAKRNGSIPDAKHLEWTDLLDAKTQKFKSADEISRLFKEAGIDPSKPSVTYCQSGGRAAVMAFGLELMGGKDVRNYYRSWSEWGNADDTPVVKAKK